MLRRIAYHSRQTARRLTRKALDAIDPPADALEPLAVDAPQCAAPSAPLSIIPEATPNPLATRYGLSRSLGLVDGHTPLGKRLMAIPGVASVYGTDDFISITRQADANIHDVEGAVLAILKRA